MWWMELRQPGANQPAPTMAASAALRCSSVPPPSTSCLRAAATISSWVGVRAWGGEGQSEEQRVAWQDCVWQMVCLKARA